MREDVDPKFASYVPYSVRAKNLGWVSKSDLARLLGMRCDTVSDLAKLKLLPEPRGRFDGCRRQYYDPVQVRTIKHALEKMAYYSTTYPDEI